MKKETRNSKSIGFLNLELGISACQRGFTLFYALLITSLLLALGLAVFNITYKGYILSSGARDSTGAFYAADAGLECALFWDLKHTGISSPAFGFYGDSLSSGIDAYWRFEDGDGDEAVDSSGHNNTGELVNLDDTAWVDGQVGEALQFDGTDGYVSVEDAASVSLPSTFTISAWVRPTVLKNYGNVLWKSPDGSTSGYGIITFVDGSWNWQSHTSAGWTDVAGGAAGSLANGTWTNIMVTYNGYRIRTYTNGTLVSSPAKTSVTDNDSELIIGADIVNGRYFNGTIDDVRIYNRVLNATERTAVVNGQSNLVFTDPVVQGSGVLCAGADISNPATGWDPDAGWDVATTTDAATTTLDIEFAGGRCAFVEVLKNISTTTIISRGYNTCDFNNPRRVERAIQAIY